MAGIERIFEVGDLVAVFGGSISREEKSASDISICEVLVCGQRDLIVQNCKNNSFVSSEHTFKVSKNLCSKLFMEAEFLENSKVTEAKIGDLVMSFEKETYTRKEPIKKTGILYKIIYKFGKPYKGSLISGNEMVDVFYEDLLVIQSNREEIE